MAEYTYTDVDKEDSGVPDSTLRVFLDPTDGAVFQIKERDYVLYVRIGEPKAIRELAAFLTAAAEAIETAP